MEIAPRCTPFTLFMLSKSLSLPLQLCVCPYILLGKVRTLLEWADELLSKMLDWMDDIPDMTTRAPEVLTNEMTEICFRTWKGFNDILDVYR